MVDSVVNTVPVVHDVIAFGINFGSSACIAGGTLVFVVLAFLGAVIAVVVKFIQWMVSGQIAHIIAAVRNPRFWLIVVRVLVVLGVFIAIVILLVIAIFFTLSFLGRVAGLC